MLFFGVCLWEQPTGEALKRTNASKKNQHFTVPVVLVEMGTLLKLARVSILLCYAHEKNQKYASSMRKWDEQYVVP